MVRACLTALTVVTTAFCGPLSAQARRAQEPVDLRVELRSATGSTRFQLDDVIPLEILISSSNRNRYLEPCEMFRQSCFGFPKCRFQTQWSFHVYPEAGWHDKGLPSCGTVGGPSYEVQSLDLTPEAKRFSYVLTDRFRFDTPGKYTVRFLLTVGLDDESNQISHPSAATATATVKQNSVSKTAEIIVTIVQ